MKRVTFTLKVSVHLFVARRMENARRRQFATTWDTHRLGMKIEPGSIRIEPELRGFSQRLGAGVRRSIERGEWQ